ncbi:MAG: lig, partial [Rhodospirillales bacterium]|nr:lig [Rhodospirillales bacterium]
RGGRSPSWLKIKAIGQEELVVAGFTDPSGGRPGFRSLMLGYYDPAGVRTCAGHVGTGYSDKLLTSLPARLDAIT